jgi:hypothetical protein
VCSAPPPPQWHYCKFLLLWTQDIFILENQFGGVGWVSSRTGVCRQESGYGMKNRWLDAEECSGPYMQNDVHWMTVFWVSKLNGDHNGQDGPGTILGIARFFSSQRQDRLYGPPRGQWVPGAISTGLKRPVREVYQSPSSAEVLNGGGIPTFSDMSSWHGA